MSDPLTTTHSFALRLGLSRRATARRHRGRTGRRDGHVNNHVAATCRAAGSTGVVFVLIEGKEYPHSNIIERSSGGKDSFRKVGSIPIKTAPLAGALQIRQLLFANAEDGFAFGEFGTDPRRA